MGRIEPLKAWDEERLGSQLSLDNSKKTARRTAETHPLGPGCVAYGKQQLGNFAEGRFAEVIISQQGSRATESEYHAGGVVIGITKCKPHEFPDDCRSIFHVPDSWVVDTYGDLWRVPEQRDFPVDGFSCDKTVEKVVDWDTYARVKDGDRIGVLLRPDRTLKVYWNGKNVGDLPISSVEVTSEVRLIVEVVGRAEAVKINTEAKAPEIPLPPGANSGEED